MLNIKYHRAGNAAFASDTENFTCDENGCYRIILLRSLGYRTKTDDIERQTLTFGIGKSNEEIIETILKRDGWLVEREVEYSKHISDNLSVMCHTDIVASKDGLTIPFELKSITSIRSHINYVVKGKYKLNNLAQLAYNMLLGKHNQGYLAYTTFIYAPAGCEFIEGTKKPGGLSWPKITPGIKKYKVEFDEYSILVDDEVVDKYNISHIVKHMVKSVQIIKDQEVSTVTPSATSACFFCKLKGFCEELKRGDISKEEWLEKSLVVCEKDR